MTLRITIPPDHWWQRPSRVVARNERAARGRRDGGDLVSGVIRWEDPPPSRHGKGMSHVAYAHNLIAVQLKRRPGEWAVIAENPPSMGWTHYLTNGRLAAYRPAGAFEAVARTTDDGVYCVYARYVGPPTITADDPDHIREDH